MKKLGMLLTAFFIVGVYTLGAYAMSPVDTSTSTACTMEAKLCPDGKTWSGRTGPNCEFECPDSNGDDVFCTEHYDPVCAQPPMSKCPFGADCIQVMPDLQTYSNSCEAGKAGAEIVYEGECNGNNIYPFPGEPEPIEPLPEPTPTKYYVADIYQCQLIDYICEDKWTYFSDDIGCGCEKKTSLSEKTQEKLDNRLNALYEKLEERYDSITSIKRYLNRLIGKLEELGEKNERYMELVEYVINHITIYIATLDDDDALQDIIDLLK